MGFRDGLRAALGGGSASQPRPSNPSTQDRAKLAKQAKKEAAARKDRVNRHKHTVRRYGDRGSIPFD
jgi:hypothetical protein